MNDQNNIKQTNTTNISCTKVFTQQIFHKGLFENRPRTNSLNDILVPTTQELENYSEPQDKQARDKANWEEVTGKKRLRASPDSNKGPAKQTKLSTYWLSQTQPILTSNSFSQLVDDDTKDPETEPKEKPIKPPPIFVDKVQNIQPLISLLNNHVQNNYELKVLNNEQVKIQPKTPDAYRETEF